MEENNEEKNDKSVFKGFRRTINKFYFIGTIILTIVLSIVCIIGLKDDYGWAIIFVPIGVALILWLPYIKGRIISKFFNWIISLFKK